MTLIEIMVVLAIIAIVMGLLIGPKVLGDLGQARRKAAWMMGRELESAYVRWASDHEAPCPDRIEELLPLTNQKENRDPWGTPLIMRCGDTAPPGAAFGVVSLGPDRKESDDDIASWLASPKR